MKYYYIFFCIFSIITKGYGQKNIPWKVSSPEEQGMSSLTLINGIQKLKQDNTNIHSLLVIRNDHIVLDACFYPFQKNYVHDIASVTKSITSLLIGIAIDKGFIKNEDEQVITYFPEYTVKNDTLKNIRIKHLLNMASGWQCSWNDREKELQQMQENPDWVEFMFALSFSSEPGEKFSYCSGNFYLLAEILQRATKMKCHEFARKYLFDLLQFSNTYWEENDIGVNFGWGDFIASPYDLAKIGCLLLNDGKWNGKQIISNEWLKKIKPLYYIHGTESYGYGWWLDSENPDEIQALGRGGQRLFILREKNLVIAVTGGGLNSGDIDNLVLESIKSYHKDETHNAELKNLIKTIESPGIKSIDRKSIDGNGFSASMLNKTFHLEKNDLEWNTIRFEKRNKEYYLVLDFTDGSKEQHPIGMGNKYKISKEHVFGLPIAIKSFWDKNKLIMDYNRLCKINLYKFSFVFYENSVDFDFQDLTNKRNVLLKGIAVTK
ncbi:class C beta-lactamase-related serine hydrolase [Pedobacter chinensis]|uniref:Class C beta-lactamase-related serine hydrolase n=1 Tax=Pedobacter chinensis TaxID=2282421 RepID=A0A369Q7F9_9SPHI|nr:serine hydrolase [Pedobacter chinensis]RDC58218.1 class C beta-lactamase-related serine hydrolase [Pedobacter chinensis]